MFHRQTSQLHSHPIIHPPPFGFTSWTHIKNNNKGFFKVLLRSLPVARRCFPPPPESIEWFIEGPCFFRRRIISSSPMHTIPPLPSASCPCFSVFLGVSGRAYTDGREGGGGRGAKSYVGEKAWSSINHSILFDSPPPHTQTWLWLGQWCPKCSAFRQAILEVSHCQIFPENNSILSVKPLAVLRLCTYEILAYNTYVQEECKYSKNWLRVQVLSDERWALSMGGGGWRRGWMGGGVVSFTIYGAPKIWPHNVDRVWDT